MPEPLNMPETLGWAPDGKWVCALDDKKIKMIPISGGGKVKTLLTARSSSAR
jgi:hypothetical protein